jgi:hypothetical protein
MFLGGFWGGMGSGEGWVIVGKVGRSLVDGGGWRVVGWLAGLPMLDPFTALALANSIVQFVDFTGQMNIHRP